MQVNMSRMVANDEDVLLAAAGSDAGATQVVTEVAHAKVRLPACPRGGTLRRGPLTCAACAAVCMHSVRSFDHQALARLTCVAVRRRARL